MGSSVMDLPDSITPRHQSIPLFTTTSFNGTIDPISGSEEFEYKPKRFTMPPPNSPGRRGYKKPSKPREFAKSAKKRQSVLALGSITHLQHFYAKRGIIIKPKKPKRVEEAEKKMNLSINTNITDLLKVTEEPDDFPPTPLPPSPPPLPAYITSKLDKEVDPEVLLATCHKNIQAMIEVWYMVTGEVKSEENPVPVDILAAIETTTKTVQSVKNYSMSKQDLSPESSSKIRSAALEVLEMVSDLEQSHRDDDTDDSSSEDGHIYKESNYRSLDKQRAILRKYLEVVEESLLFDDIDIYPPNTSYLRPSSISSEEDLKQQPAVITPPLSPGHPNNDWVNPDVFGDDVLARYHAFLEAHRPSKSKRASDYTPLPDPCVDKTEFLASLSDGKLLCVIYNTIVRRSKRPFGFIDKIHEDTSRTYRATENLKFFAAAAKFRFDLKFDEFNVTEIVKLTNTGKSQLERILEVFCEAAMQELISTGCYRQYPSSRVTSMYLQDSLSNSQMQLLQQATTNDLAAALSEKLSIHRSSTPSSPTLSRKSSHESS